MEVKAIEIVENSIEIKKKLIETIASKYQPREGEGNKKKAKTKLTI